METATLLELIGAVIGLSYLVAEYKAHISLWYIGILMSLFYIVIFATSTLYANAGIYGYNLCANIYGLIVWQKVRNQGGKLESEERISCCPKSIYGRLSAIWAGCFAVVYTLLLWANGSSLAVFCDGFTASVSIVAMWLLAHKYLEHWYLWIIINFISVVMCVATSLYFSAFMFAIYVIVSVLGLRHWKQLQRVD